jgi:cytochrome c oxidase cbb3-type subunit III
MWLHPWGRNVCDRRIWRSYVIAALVFVTTLFFSQERPTANPDPNDPTVIKEGASLFRANCSPCHGAGARGGGRGPDLTSGHWTHGSTDADIFRTITQGVSGTEMPANAFEDTEIWTIIAYLRSLTPPKSTASAGDRVAGEAVFQQKRCAVCHMVKGQGGLLGPDLSRVGAARSMDYLVDSIRTPDKDLSLGMVDPNSHFGPPLVYDTVTVVTAKGETIVGVAKDEDTFSIQLMDRRQNLHLLLKKDLQQVKHEQKSLMPAYSDEMIAAADLQNLVAYLQSLRGD